MFHIWNVKDKKEEKFLRSKTKNFDFNKFSRKEVTELINRMKKAMQAANGIGLSANQIGIDLRVFVAQVPDRDGGLKFYAVFNPEIQKSSSEKVLLDEGCLSVPGVYGDVERFERLTLKGFDRNNKSLKIKAWGLLARVFQHEVDHLNGILFIDKAKKLYEIDKTDLENGFKKP